MSNQSSGASDENKNATPESSRASALEASTEYFAGDYMPADVFVNKYALTSPQGIVEERSPDDMHRRVAKEFARIESRYINPLSEDLIYSYFKDFKYIIPQGSPLSAIGNPYQVQSASNCFAAGTQVTTLNRGPVAIEDVVVGDLTVTHTGAIGKISQTHKNPLDGRDVYRIKCMRTKEVRVTGNHKFMSITKEQMEWGEAPQWNSVETLRKGDYIASPHRIEQPSWNDSIDAFTVTQEAISSGLTAMNISVTASDAKTSIALYYSKPISKSVSASDCASGEGGCAVAVRQEKQLKRVHREINRFWSVDEDFAMMLGVWYGDGCIFSDVSEATAGERNRKETYSTHRRSRLRGITFTLNSKETSMIDFIIKTAERTFGIPADVNVNPKDSTTQIVFHSSQVALVFLSLFGRGFSGKTLYADAYNWPKGHVEAFLKGLISSDGTVTSDGGVRVAMRNENFINQVYHCARINGISVGMSTSVVQSGSNFSKGPYSVSRLDFSKNSRLISGIMREYDDDRIQRAIEAKENTIGIIKIGDVFFHRIDEKEKVVLKDDYVYTIGVDNDHSYAVEGLMSLNCFVLPSPADSYGGIARNDEEMVQIMKRRGGVGFDLSTLRPRGMTTQNAARTTDGVPVFMERYSNSCREVAQGGRRGALLLSIDVRHPDVLEFVRLKRDPLKCTGANVSVRVNDEFMEAVEKDETYTLQWPCESSEPEYVVKVRAREVFDEIVESAWLSGCPGLLFWDTARKMSPADAYESDGFKSLSTNPCGEIILSAYDSCRLMVLNATSFVNRPFSENPSFDFHKFGEAVRVAQRLMDDMIDIEIECVDKIIKKIQNDPEAEEIKKTELNLWLKIKSACLNGRRTGLGLTGLGDVFAYMNMRYGSKPSVDLCGKIYRELALNAYISTIQLASERGAFPAYNYHKECDHPFIRRILAELPAEVNKMYYKFGRRNIALTTTAPVGSISILLGTTSGIEPVFALESIRRRKLMAADGDTEADSVDKKGDRWKHYVVNHPGFAKWKEVTGLTDVSKSPYHRSTANEINYIEKVNLQSAAQAWICHSISNTTNLPREASRQAVRDVYMHAWRTGCKGVTVYRDGSKDGVLLHKDSVASNVQDAQKIVSREAPKRPAVLPCSIFHSNIDGEQWTILVGTLDGKPYEIFGGLSKYVSIPKKWKTGNLLKESSKKKGEPSKYSLKFGEGEDEATIHDVVQIFENPTYGSFTRLLSAALRHGTPVNFVVEQLQKGDKDADMYSFSRVIARVLKGYISDGTEVRASKICDNCNTPGLVYVEGCATCQTCGNSKCS